jgi:hypothetical protein
MKQCAALAALLTVVLAGPGCAPSAAYPFRFVDAESGEGIQGVRVESILIGHYFNNRTFPANSGTHADQALTDADGRATLNLVSGDDGLAYLLHVVKPGYEAMTGRIYPTAGDCRLTRRIGDALPSPGVLGELPDIAVGPGVVARVPMRRLSVD